MGGGLPAEWWQWDVIPAREAVVEGARDVSGGARWLAIGTGGLSELWVGDGGAVSRSGSCGSGMGLNHGGFECFLEVRFGGSVWNTVDGFVLWFDEWGFGGLLMVGSRWVRDSGAGLLLLQSAFASTRVTTVVAMNVLGASYPPSAGAFSGEAFIAVNDDASFLVRPGSPLCSRSTVTLPLPQTQSTFSVRLKINTANVYISISETGWPRAGTNPYTSKENALMYNANLTFMS
uniref:Uncharacterized protein n=1 Tax=Fagus sylvatica TaxID=28930 RepID=A0A2N9G7A7_FAGSY